MTAAVDAIPANDLPPLTQERPQDAIAVTRLIDQAFGPGRYAKAAERLREGNRPRLDLSLTCWSGEVLVGSVRQWAIHIGDQPAIFLGPICVDQAWRSRGLGGALITAACEADHRAGAALVLLVGDESLFGIHGFQPVPPGRIVMPRPVDPRRLLAKPFAAGVLDKLQGVVRPG